MYLFLKIKTKQLVSRTTLFYKESALIIKKDNKFIKEYYFMAQFWECPASFALDHMYSFSGVPFPIKIQIRPKQPFFCEVMCSIQEHNSFTSN